MAGWSGIDNPLSVPKIKGLVSLVLVSCAVPYSGLFSKSQFFENIQVNMISKKYFLKHLNQHHFEKIFSKILQCALAIAM